MKLRKIAAAVLSLTLVCGAVPCYVSADVVESINNTMSSSEIASGDCGDPFTGSDVTWVLDDTYTLTISGEGRMHNTDVYPWSGYKKSITNIIIEDGVTSIGRNAFSNCVTLTAITIPDSVIEIGWYAFSNCNALTSVTIPDSVTIVEEGVFNSCKALTAINVDADNSNYASDDGVFFNKDMTTLIQYPAGKTDGAYKIPDSVKNIESCAFENCSLLKSVTTGKKVTNIGDYAFQNCVALTSIIIPHSVTSIGNGLFDGCDAFTSVTIKNPECQIGRLSYAVSADFVIYGYENSTAQAYAEENNMEFISLGEYVEIETLLGDTDNDGVINSSDASNVLAAYAKIATGGESPFTEEQMKAADVNNDGAVDSSDASSILAYYAYTATGGTESLEEFLA